jgi:eukaryotic-like serine/threonine-protein kinase
MDAEVEALAKEMRLREARELAAERGDRVRAFELAMESRETEAMDAIAATFVEGEANRARASAVRRRDPFAEAIAAEAGGALDDAVELFDRAEAHGRSAAIHKKRGDVARAGRALERQIKRDPTDVAARRALAEVLLAVDKPDAALRALSGVGDDDEARALRARAHERLGLSDAATSSPAPPPVHDDPRTLFGRYEVIREVSSTASARVLEARDRLDPQKPRVALKIFTGSGHAGAGRDALVRFQREVEALSKIDAPGVLRPRAFLAEGPTLVLPWAAGGSVADLVSRGIPSPRRAAEIVDRVVEALDAAHRRGIIHRDIKPANVLLDEAGGVYLADFGVAHLGDASATATAGVIGTARYMAPEQRRGEPATARSDLYAIGIMFAELLGVRIDGGGDPVADLIRDCCAEDPSQRVADAASLRARIAAISWPDEAVAKKPSAPPSLRPASLEGARFEVHGALRRDRVLERDELLVASDDPRRALAEALAAIVHPALPLVLGVENGAMRVEVLEGAPVERLSGDERAVVSAALTAIHRRGAAHGSVATSLRRTARGVVLRFPDVQETASAVGDLHALSRV